MSQNGEVTNAKPEQQAQNINQTTVITFAGVHGIGMKVRIPNSICKLLKNSMMLLGVQKSSFVNHLVNSSKNGIYRGDMDLYVLNAEQAELIIAILTKLGFVKDSTDKSNDKTFRIYLDVICQKFSHEAIMPCFNLPEGSNPDNYYIELEIKIATEFQKAYESNCLGYFLGLLLSRYLKISISGVWLKHGCGVIPLNIASFDDFLKKIGINLDGIRTAEEFIERLLATPLISELLTVKDILHIYSNIMGDEKTKHTSKPLREWLYLLLCGLKNRFPDQFSSLRSELVKEMVRDEKSGQMIPVWSVRLFVLNQGSKNEVQIGRGDLFIGVSGEKLFVSTDADEMSLIFSEEQLKQTVSGKQALPVSMNVCSYLFQYFNNYLDYLKDIYSKNHFVEKFIDAFECCSEVNSHIEDVGCKLMTEICEQLTKPLYPVKNKKSDLMNNLKYGNLIIDLKRSDVSFSQFEASCFQRLGLTGDYKSFLVEIMNDKIFDAYSSRINALSSELSPEEHKQTRKKIYDDMKKNIVDFCLVLVKQWTLFHNSELFWKEDKTVFFHIQSDTNHEMTSNCLPFYLGKSMIEEVPSDSSKFKGKKTQKEKPQVKPVPEEKPQGKPVHVFMDGQSGEIFTVPISK